MRIGDTYKMKCRKDRPIEVGDIIYVLNHLQVGFHYGQPQYEVITVHQDDYNIFGYTVFDEYESDSYFFRREVPVGDVRSCNCESCDDSISKTNKIKEVK